MSLTLLLAQQPALLRLRFEDLVPALKRVPNSGRASGDVLMEEACALKVSNELDRLKKAYKPDAV